MNDAQLAPGINVIRQMLEDGDSLDIQEAKLFVQRAPVAYGKNLTDFGGMIHTGQGEDVKEQPKGCFTRTTYADRLENETEYGWKATAYRLMRNIVRNFDEQESSRGKAPIA